MDAAFDELRDTLWYQLECRCQRCGMELDLSDLLLLKERDPHGWSRLAAERAIAEGWRPIADVIGAVCPACAANA